MAVALSGVSIVPLDPGALVRIFSDGGRVW